MSDREKRIEERARELVETLALVVDRKAADRLLGPLRAALSSPQTPPDGEGEREEVYAAARALLDAISHWDLTAAVDIASARLERALAAPRPPSSPDPARCPTCGTGCPGFDACECDDPLCPCWHGSPPRSNCEQEPAPSPRLEAIRHPCTACGAVAYVPAPAPSPDPGARPATCPECEHPAHEGSCMEWINPDSEQEGYCECRPAAQPQTKEGAP